MLFRSPNTSANFATDLAANKWQKFNGGINFRSVWTNNTTYLVSDVVTYLGSAYICTADNLSSNNFLNDLAANNWILFVQGGKDALPSYVKSYFLTNDGTNLYWSSGLFNHYLNMVL